MFWVRLKDGSLEIIPGDSYKETKHGHRILKGERWIAEYQRENLVALYRDPPTALWNTTVDQVIDELAKETQPFVENQLAEDQRDTMKEKLAAWLEVVRQQMHRTD